MSSAFEQLTALVPPPDPPVDPPSASRIADIESRINLTLPDDFKQIVRAYGAGQWQSFFCLFDLSLDSAFDDWRSPADRTAGTMELQLPYMRMCREVAGECGLDDWDFPIFPEAGGLLPWAVTENGGCLFWLTKGGRSKWPTIYFPDDRRVEFEELQLSCSEILVGLMSGENPIFGDDMPSIANGASPDELFQPATDD
jgi:hypothetical protein